MTDEPTTTAGDLADQAAEAIRALNEGTHPAEGAPAIEVPNDLAALFGGLALMAGRLPQLLAQSGGWLEHHIHQLDAHGGMFDGDPVAAVATAQAVLADATTAALALARHLRDVQNVLAALAQADIDD